MVSWSVKTDELVPGRLDDFRQQDVKEEPDADDGGACRRRSRKGIWSRDDIELTAEHPSGSSNNISSQKRALKRFSCFPVVSGAAAKTQNCDQSK